MSKIKTYLKEHTTAFNPDLPPPKPKAKRKAKTILKVDEETGKLRCGNCGAADVFRRRPKGTYIQGLLPIAMTPRTHYCGVCGERNWTPDEIDAAERDSQAVD
jgi:hypothetical protein